MSDDGGERPDGGGARAPGPVPSLGGLEALLPWADGNIDLAIGPGWVQLVTDLHADLVALVPGYRAITVKEKFGGLRFYAHHAPEVSEQVSARFHARIQLAESEARELCEECGAIGWLVADRGRLRTVCERHGRL